MLKGKDERDRDPKKGTDFGYGDSKEQMRRDKRQLYGFKLFAYLTMTILTIAVIVGTLFVIQHQQEEERGKITLANQESVMKNQELINDNTKKALENQHLLKELLNQIRTHENKEEKMIAENLTDALKTAISNAHKIDVLDQKLNKIMGQLNIPTR